jgi:glycogen debranching enzyme
VIAMQDSESKFYIQAGAAPPDERVAVLKHGDTFGLFDRFGDISGVQGLYHEDTRHLSTLSLRFADQRPLLLSSNAQDTEAGLSVHLTNNDIDVHGEEPIARGSLHVVRSKFLWQAVCHELVQVRHYGSKPVTVRLVLEFRADFADIFEVRGTPRPKRGTIAPAMHEGQGAVIRYDGLDGCVRFTRLSFSSVPHVLDSHLLEFVLSLAPGEESALRLSISCEQGARRSAVFISRADYETAHEELAKSTHTALVEYTQVSATSARFNDFMTRSMGDLCMMTTDTPDGPYPYAGVPWFSTPFGRDGLITALQTLWVQPGLARGVLRYLAKNQSQSHDPARAAEPGKILHESRKGEMANLGEVPFGRYYGSVDATPLFVMLAGAYYRSTGDRALVDEIWPSIEAALMWIEKFGDLDGDGFVEYASDPAGLIHQGWKDSSDSVFHADGSDAEGPIALCEVQGYVYAAYRAAELLSGVLGLAANVERFRRAAQDLRVRFEQKFWCDRLGTYALALDGQKRPCEVRSSNAGHCLYAGIASAEHGAQVARNLMAPASFSGWGIRTIASGTARYNPMSYHNGSVWPHDSALLCAGLSAYGFRAEALRVFMGLYDASLHLGTKRLPELFCGFSRESDLGPTLYPVACSPQTWASGASFMMLQACLGLTIDARARRVVFSHPVLPPYLHELCITNLRVGSETVDLIVHRYPEDVGINVVRRSGPVEVVNIK